MIANPNGIVSNSVFKEGTYNTTNIIKNDITVACTSLLFVNTPMWNRVCLSLLAEYDLNNSAIINVTKAIVLGPAMLSGPYAKLFKPHRYAPKVDIVIAID